MADSAALTDIDAEDLEDAFEAAAAYVATATGSLQSDVLLSLYGYYKRATAGPCEEDCPSIFDRRGRAKW